MPGKPTMPQLKAAFESAGFTNVKTVLGSGNVVFDTRGAGVESLARRADAAMESEIGRAYPAIVRSLEDLHALLEADPFAPFERPSDAKRVVTFLREPPKAKLGKLPLVLARAKILAVEGRHVFTMYQPTPGNPSFMTLIEKTFGKDVTTRTWETLQKISAAADVKTPGRGSD